MNRLVSTPAHVFFAVLGCAASSASAQADVPATEAAVPVQAPVEALQAPAGEAWTVQVDPLTMLLGISQVLVEPRKHHRRRRTSESDE